MSRVASEFQVPPFPLPLRVGLAAWRLAARFGVGHASLDEAGLIAAARRRTGLEHFVDESFRVPMRRMLHSLDAEAQLHPLGRAVMRGSVIRALECRLRLENLSDLHSEIAEAPVRAPVFVVGLQRTGTTKMHRLLDCEPTLRSFSGTEGLNPAPLGRAVRREPGEWKLRTRQARAAKRGMKYMSPALFAIHPIETDAPEEDVFLLDTTFVSPAVDASLEVPSYSKWIREIDQVDVYRYFRRLIQLLLWQRPGRWLGKTPHHLENLDALLAVFPDAKIIHLHRDPLKVVPSFASMMAHAGVMLSDAFDTRKIGRRILDRSTNAVERAIRVRDRAAAGSFLDVHYSDLVGDPVPEMRRVYEFAEIEWRSDTEQRIRTWLVQNPQRRNGAHRYRLSDFGLDAGEIDSRFKRYREHFDVAREQG